MNAFYEKEISVGRLEDGLLRLKDRIYTKAGELQAVYAATPEPVRFADRLTLDYKKIAVGEKWGNLFDCAWFHLTGKAGPSCAGKKLVFLIDVGGEGCVYDKTGSAVRGITNVNSDFARHLGMPGKRAVRFVERSRGDEAADLWIDGACNDLFGNFAGGTLVQAEIAAVNDKLRDLYYDFWVLLDLLKVLDPDTARRAQILLALDSVCNILYTYDDAEADECAGILAEQLNRKAADTGLKFYATGHAHLDLAWLWPIRETKRKALRTFSTAIELLERYPFYIFGASQPQQFLWVKEQDPVLYEKIRRMVKEGRIELQGAMWVEPDLNVTGGESLTRQILYGKRFWREEFGREVDGAHLPDVFGFNGALPQILRKSGVETLTTIKLSWNKYNTFPYHTFNWRGIDGSEVLVHMPPEGDYNSAMAPRSVARAEKNYLDKGLCGAASILYGIGDGGGGPGSEHLERLKRVANLSGLSPVVPAPVAALFDALKKDRARLKTYKGEMYLEKHQGTYTTQARNKYCNRKIEFALRDAEYFAAAAWKLKGADYPQEKLDRIWREVLLYQFHDILPGSSIKRVYDESVARYKELTAEVRGIAEAGRKLLPPKAAAPAPQKNKTPNLRVAPDVLESAALRATFNADGELISLYDKKNKREALSAPSNVLNVYEDKGDAWDMEEGYLNRPRGKFTLTGVKTCVENGRAVREQTLSYGASTVKQVVSVCDACPILDFENEADWREDFKFLKASFAPAVFTDAANCGCAFGNVKRSLLKNTPYEQAQDEICAHRYIDLSANDYGVALLNDCKYGHTAASGRIQISLLRASNHPGVNADRGEHRFSYALYPHAGAFENSDVAETAYVYNAGAQLCDLADNFLSFRQEGGAIVECVKRSEDGQGIIVRFAEEKGIQSRARLGIQFPYASVSLTTLDEKPLKTVKNLNFDLKPFEIVTVKIM